VNTVLQRIDGFARWLLLTREGRRALVIAYIAFGAFSIAVYLVTETVAYAVGMAALMAFGLWWARFCLRRPG
jgi:hypothetical protein